MSKVLKYIMCVLLVGTFIQGVNNSCVQAKALNSPSATKETTENKEQINLIKDENKTTTDKVVVNSDLKGQILAELKKRHAEGEYLDISEDLIKSLSEEELKSLLYTDTKIISDLKIGADTIEELNNKGIESIETGKEFEMKDLEDITEKNFAKNNNGDIDYNNLYSLPEKVQKNLFETIREYAQEKEEALALLALGGVGGLGLLKKGYDLLQSESMSDKINRRMRLESVTQQVFLENQRLEENYKRDISYNFSKEDNLKNLTERTLRSGVTLRQEATITNEMKRMANNTVNMYDILDNELKKKNVKNTFSQTPEYEEAKTTAKKLRSSKTIKERLEEMNEDIKEKIN